MSLNVQHSKYQVIAESPNFIKALQKASQYAKSDWPVLILGQTGTGKECIAKRIHENSERFDKPFVTVNCGALPGDLFESEFFGYERGSFTGAGNGSKGLVGLANGGTIFLDEIGDLEFYHQVKLLRMVEYGEIRSVGGNRTNQVDIRIIAATNLDLHAAIQSNEFRHDLLERIGVLTIDVPSLSERHEDLLALLEHFMGQSFLTLSSQSIEEIFSFHWPGNIRQLRNFTIRLANLLPGETIEASVTSLIADEKRRYPPKHQNKNDLMIRSGTLDQIERAIIFDRLTQNNGSRKETAEDLGIAKSTLQEKLKKWGQEGDSCIPASRKKPKKLKLKTDE